MGMNYESVTICECGLAKSYHPSKGCAGSRVSRASLILKTEQLESETTALREQIRVLTEALEQLPSEVPPTGAIHC
jgi:hypothetical protein